MQTKLAHAHNLREYPQIHTAHESTLVGNNLYQSQKQPTKLKKGRKPQIHGKLMPSKMKAKENADWLNL